MIRRKSQEETGMAELFPGRVDPQVGSGWVGSGRVQNIDKNGGSGRVQTLAGRVGSKYPDPT